MSGFTAIEVAFPCAVEITAKQQQDLDRIVGEICNDYVATHPGRVMWPAGIGFKPTFIPITAEQEATRGIEFDEGTFQIDCAEREDYDWKCAKCGIPQGDHGHCITEPAAGECEFAVASG